MTGDYPRSGRAVEAGGRALAVCLLGVIALVSWAACSPPPAGSPASPAEASASAGAAAEESHDAPLVIFLGDSLTAGLGLSEEQAFPALIGARLRARGLSVRVVHAGVSGDTTAGGLDRLDWLLRQKPRVLVVGLGANDALRGQPLESTERNLLEILRRGKRSGARVLLLGMRIPVNYGPSYTGEFAALYPRVARTAGVPLVPFLLEGVGGHAELNLPDGIHPNAQGQEIVAENVLQHLLPLLAP